MKREGRTKEKEMKKEEMKGKEISPKHVAITATANIPEGSENSDGGIVYYSSKPVDYYQLTKADAERILSRYNHVLIGQLDQNELSLVLNLRRFVEA